MAKMIELTRTFESRKVLVNVDNIAYVESNPDGTSTIGFNYGGGFSVFQSIVQVKNIIKDVNK